MNAATVRAGTIRVLSAVVAALKEHPEHEVPTPAALITFVAPDGNVAQITAAALPGPFERSERRSGFKAFTDLACRTGGDGPYLESGVWVTITAPVADGGPEGAAA